MRRVDVAGFEITQAQLAVLAGQIDAQPALADDQHLVALVARRREQGAARHFLRDKTVEQPRRNIRNGAMQGL